MLSIGPTAGSTGGVAGGGERGGVRHSGEVTSAVHTTRAGGAHFASGTVTVSGSPAACSDGSYNLMGPRWKSTLRWSFRASTTPSGLSATGVLAILKRGFANIAGARNDCGRGDRVSLATSYLGNTSSKIGVTSGGRCATGDGRNVVGFGSLPEGVLGVTCIRSSDGRVTEIDIRINSATRWALALTGCTNRYLLEAVTTHEVGHAVGLSHVSESSHGRLTMSTHLNGTCQNAESTLGLGDLRGLEALY